MALNAKINAATTATNIIISHIIQVLEIQETKKVIANPQHIFDAP